MNVFELFAKIGLDTSEYDSTLASIAGKTAKGFGAAVTAGTAAVGAIAGASVKAGSAFDVAMSQVGATMLKTSEEMQNEVGSVDTSFGHFEGTLRDFAQYMGSNTAFSATEAAEALNYMALAGYSTQQSMDMLPNVLSLASAGAMDLAKASDMVTDTQTAFGISAERTSLMVDEMAKTASISNTSVEQLGEAFLTVGGLAKELNGGFVQLADGTMAPVDGVQELEIALGAMANAGIKGSEAGTHMRNMLMKLASPTSDGTKQLEALGVAVFDDAGQMRSLHDIMGDLNGALGDLTQEEKLNAISDLFNARDIASAEAILSAVESDWDNIGQGILDAEGSAAEMAEIQLDNLSGDVTLFKSALEGAEIAISDTLSPSLREFVQFGTNGLSELTEAFKSGGLSGAMDAFGGLLADGLSMIISKLPDFIQAGMDLVMSLGKGLFENIDVIIDAALQIVDVLANGLMENAPEIVKGAFEIIAKLATSLGEALPELIPTAVEIIIEIVNSIVDNADMLIDGAIALVMGLVDGIVTAIPILLEKIPEIVLKLADGFAENAIKIEDAAISIIMTLAQCLIENAPALIQAVIQITVAVTASLLEYAGTRIQQIGQAIGEWIAEYIVGPVGEWLSGIWDKITEFFQPLVDFISPFLTAIADLVSAVFELIRSIISNVMENVRNKISSAWNAILNVINPILTAIKSGVQTAFNALVNLVSTPLNNIKTNVSNVFSNIKETILNIVNSAKTWGRDMIANLAQGIKDKLSSVTDAISNVASNIRSRIHFSEPDMGPLSDFSTYAPDMMKLFAEGITNNTHLVTDAMDEAFDFDDVFADTVDIGRGRYADGGASQEIIFNQTVNSPKQLNPSEIARQSKNATRQMALALGGIR